MSTETAKSWLVSLLAAIGGFFSKLWSSFKMAVGQTLDSAGFIVGTIFAIMAVLGLYVGIVGAAPWSWIPMAVLHDTFLYSGFATMFSIAAGTILNMFRFEDTEEANAWMTEERDYKREEAVRNVQAVAA